MRKWMSDRLKRRKKTAEEGKGEAKPAPLQPAYFDKQTPAKESSEHERPLKTDRPASEPRRSEAHESDLPSSVERVEHPEQIRGSENRHSESRQSSVSPSEDRQHNVEPLELERDAHSQEAEAGGVRQGSASAGQGGDSSDLQRRRRRRGRGGRGRGRNASGQPVVATAPDVEPSRLDHAEPVPQAARGVLSSVPTAVDAAANAAARTSKGRVVLAIGLPGSGKSSWFKRHGISPLSSDLVRALLFDDPTEQRFQDLVFSNLRSMLKARLIARRPTNYVDATNLTPHERHGWIKLAKDYGYEVQAVFFDVPLETCLERNHKRQRVVSDEVMRRMSEKLKAPTFEEGFSKITVVRVKQKE
jgi:predicted kinase